MSGADSKCFYVYVHKRKDDGQIFYVGKGARDRFRSKSGRSQRWKYVVAKHGFIPLIHSDGMSEEDAFAEEMFLIASLRAMGVNLVNHADGGGWGCTGYRHTEDSLKKMSAAKKGKSLPQAHVESIKAGWRPRHRVSPAEAVSSITSAWFGFPLT